MDFAQTTGRAPADQETGTAGDVETLIPAEIEELDFSTTAVPERRIGIWRTPAARRDSRYRRLLAGADVLAVALSMVVAFEAIGDSTLSVWAFGIPLVWVVIAKSMGLYERDEHLLHKSTLDEVPALFSLAAITALVVSLLGDQLIDGSLSQVQVGVAWAALFLAAFGLRAVARATARAITPPERCLFVGDTRTARYVRDKLAISHAVKAELIGTVPPQASTNGNGHASNGGDGHEHLMRALRPILEGLQIDRVILSNDAGRRDDLLEVIRVVKSHGVKVSVLPEASRVAGSAVELDHLHGMTLLGMRRFEITRSSRAIKRSVDLVGSSLALLMLSPLLIVAAVAIKLDTRGPVFYRQRRVGLGGEEFEMLKFRSMVGEADSLRPELEHLNEGADGLFKIADDPRITRVGRWLRGTQFDEVPQFFNVLRGEMSLVGPRPLIPEEDRRIVGWYRRRLDVRPGMTGHWQVLGSSQRIPLDEMVKLDYLYLANWSLWGDITLLLRTIPFVVSRRGL